MPSFFFLCRCERTDEKIARDAVRREPRILSRKVLPREDLRRSHDGNLIAMPVFPLSQDEVHRREERHDRLARADISLEHARHRIRRLHVFEYLKKDDFLLVRQRKRK